MQRIRLFEIIGLLVILSLTGIACVSSIEATNAQKLEGVTWVLKSYGEPNNPKAAVADKDVTLTFDKDKKTVGGHGGVNAYGGKYEIDGDELKITEIYSTMIAGPEPLRSQEITYFRILGSAESYKIEGQELTITGTEGVLVFTQK